MKKVFILLIVLGFILSFRTASLSDTELISGMKLYIDMFVALCVTATGFIGAYICESRGQRKSAPGTHNTRNAFCQHESQQLQNKYITIGKDCQYETSTAATHKFSRH